MNSLRYVDLCVCSLADRLDVLPLPSDDAAAVFVLNQHLQMHAVLFRLLLHDAENFLAGVTGILRVTVDKDGLKTSKLGYSVAPVKFSGKTFRLSGIHRYTHKQS